MDRIGKEIKDAFATIEAVKLVENIFELFQPDAQNSYGPPDNADNGIPGYAAVANIPGMMDFDQKGTVFYLQCPLQFNAHDNCCSVHDSSRTAQRLFY